MRSLAVGDCELHHGARRALDKPSQILHFGPLRYRFNYTIQPTAEAKESFEVELKAYFQDCLHAPAPHHLTSATPSDADTKLGEWTLRGTAGEGSEQTLIHAASHSDGTMAAFKRLSFKSRRQAEKSLIEVQLYRDINTSLSQHPNAIYILGFKELIDPEKLYSFCDKPREVYLVWTPLAQHDWHRLTLTQPYSPQESRKRLVLIKQVLKGLAALHSKGYVHRDIKPPNLGVVSQDPPQAVILDLGQAMHVHSDSLLDWIDSTPGFGGTVGYHAPEMEMKDSSYGKPVDIWALGCVAYEILIGRLSWKRAWNPWREFPADPKVNMEKLMDMQAEARLQHHSIRQKLARSSRESAEHLISRMLDASSNARCTAEQALDHPVMRELGDVDAHDEPRVGSKRAAA